MRISDVSLPDIYKQSADFRFFIDWFEKCLTKVQYDTENMSDIYDPLRCPEDILWMLCDTMGYKYDDRLPVAFNRLVLLYFMAMIRLKGSKNGITLAAETNLSQFKIQMLANVGYTDDNDEFHEPNDILNNRLEDVNIPVNAVYVTPHPDLGYIDLVYFSTKKPVDACIEYVRPLGMYLFQYSGARMDSRTKISIDARLTNIGDTEERIGITHIAHYTRNDYAKLQDMMNSDNGVVPNSNDNREPVYYRNSKYESKNQYADSDGNYTGEGTNDLINPGYRTLYSLQLCNNEQVVKSLIDPIFSLGYGPIDVQTTVTDSYLKKNPKWNLRYDQSKDVAIDDVSTVDTTLGREKTNPRPAINPVMLQLGDAIAVATNGVINNDKYTVHDKDGTIVVEDDNNSK